MSTLAQLCRQAVADGVAEMADLEKHPGHSGYLWSCTAAAIREQDASGAWEFIVEADMEGRKIPDMLADALERKYGGTLGLARTDTLLLSRLVANAIVYAYPRIQAALEQALAERGEDAINQAADRAYSKQRDQTFAEGA